MKRLLILIIPVLALLVMAAPVGAEEKHGNSPDKQVTSQADHGKSADAHSRVEDRKTDSGDREDTSEAKDTSGDENEHGAQRLQFYEVPTDGTWDNVTSNQVDGRVNVVAPGGDVALVIQGNIKSGLEADKNYEVFVRSVSDSSVDTFTTNGNGHGRFHVNIRSEDLPADTYEIQVAINVAGGATVIATPRDPLLTVTVGSDN